MEFKSDLYVLMIDIFRKLSNEDKIKFINNEQDVLFKKNIIKEFNELILKNE